jgi:mono/diheme cytochrome c family protein
MRSLLCPLLLCALAAATPAIASADDEPARPADPRRGEALYVGTVPLLAGGAPCLGCHGIAGHGLARAASFGPDLSASHEQYGADGLDAMLEDIVFPSMEPVYRGHAVTKEERADLIAFLAEANGAGAQPARLGGRFAAGVVGAMGAFLGLVVIVGKRGGTRKNANDGRTP